MHLIGILTKLKPLHISQLQPLKQIYRWYKQKLNMNTIYFRHQIADNQFLVHFRYINQGYGIDRIFNLMRSENEKVDVCLERIRANVEKEFVKKLKKQEKKKKKSTKKGDPLDDNEKRESSLVRVCFQMCLFHHRQCNKFVCILLCRCQLK